MDWKFEQDREQNKHIFPETPHFWTMVFEAAWYHLILLWPLWGFIALLLFESLLVQHWDGRPVSVTKFVATLVLVPLLPFIFAFAAATALSVEKKSKRSVSLGKRVIRLSPGLLMSWKSLRAIHFEPVEHRSEFCKVIFCCSSTPKNAKAHQWSFILTNPTRVAAFRRAIELRSIERKTDILLIDGPPPVKPKLESFSRSRISIAMALYFFGCWTLLHAAAFWYFYFNLRFSDFANSRFPPGAADKVEEPWLKWVAANFESLSELLTTALVVALLLTGIGIMLTLLGAKWLPNRRKNPTA